MIKLYKNSLSALYVYSVLYVIQFVTSFLGLVTFCDFVILKGSTIARATGVLTHLGHRASDNLIHYSFLNLSNYAERDLIRYAKRIPL